MPSLVLCIGLCLLATPVLWTHYFALLIIPAALSRPRLGPLWFLPLVLWVCPINPNPWQAIIAVGVSAILIACCALRPACGGAHENAAGSSVGDPGATPLLVTE